MEWAEFVQKTTTTNCRNRLRHDHDARWARLSDWFAGTFDFAGLGVDLKNGDVVPRHVGAQQPLAAGGDGQILRTFAETWFNRQECQLSFGADLVTSDAVVAPIRGVQIFAIRRDFQIGAVTNTIEIGGDGRDGLPLGE